MNKDTKLARLDDGAWVDLAYSADDGGWYAQRHDNDAVTECFPNRYALESALEQGTVTWE